MVASVACTTSKHHHDAVPKLAVKPEPWFLPVVHILLPCAGCVAGDACLSFQRKLLRSGAGGGAAVCACATGVAVRPHRRAH